ncbi:MAG: hypothetical protein HUJ75_07725, partial [Parasporobacterium sp.]|nr:hypothetical protein [Parasporobacterium sp.]
KLNMYKKISAIQGVEDMEDIKNELLDRFGEIPTVTENLLSVALIKSLAHGSFVSEVSGGRKEFKIIMWNRAPVDGYKLNMFLHKNSSEYHFTAERASYFTYKPAKVPKDIPQLITCLGKAFNDIKETFTEEKEAGARLLD